MKYQGVVSLPDFIFHADYKVLLVYCHQKEITLDTILPDSIHGDTIIASIKVSIVSVVKVVIEDVLY